MNVLIVSESFMVRDSLNHLFNDIFDEINVKSASNINEFDENYLYKLDFVFIDAKISNVEVVEMFAKIKSVVESLKIMVLDFMQNKDMFLKLIKLGVDGYILNIYDKEEFIYIVKKILNGKKFYDSELLQYSMVKNMNNTNTALTNREKNVLSYVCKGLSNKDIADNLNITDYTIKKHVSSILSKLNLKNRQDIIIYARDKNIVEEIG